MRIVAAFEKEDLAKRFSGFLQTQDIDNTLESNFDKKEKKMMYSIWVHNEDLQDKAKAFFDNFLSDPNSSKFDVKMEDINKNQADSKNDKPQKEEMKSRRSFPSKITFFFLFLCVALYLVNYMQELSIKKKYNLKHLVIFTPLQKNFLYDLPPQRQLLDEVIIKYQLDDEKKLLNPPEEAKSEIQKIEQMPAFMGLYDIILNKFQKNKKAYQSAPMFIKIRQGEIWRLFTPAILHSGFLHILFNMLWLWYLGKQMEPRLKFLRFILFVIIVAVLSNTAQYLMGGPYFLGFSGVITAMIGYIWVRQKTAPWEGYNIPNIIFYFIGIFIFAMLFLQIISFIMQMVKPTIGFNPGIANTAHIAGAIIGVILAKMPFFTWRSSE